MDWMPGVARFRWWFLRTGVILCAAIPGLTAADAHGSICVTTGAIKPALRVNAKGNAEVAWSTRDGRRHFASISSRSRCATYGMRIRGRDASAPTAAVKIPFKRVLRRTPDGRFWALQMWRTRANGGVELRFSRWRGAPTKLTAQITITDETARIVGDAALRARPIAGASVYVDCSGCSNRERWTRIGTTKTRGDGTYAFVVPPGPRDARYRTSVVGPNIGAILAPDAVAFA